ncbi:hypothetical protein Ciccas_006257 [Cichlidogyrus casuarinus]|uniref:Uncharacterized protein n=1 Tax=Cichlidogyrus casuarinus TaxID=1844966 RepID=A0ABD2Q8R4_9PLAT
MSAVLEDWYLAQLASGGTQARDFQQDEQQNSSSPNAIRTHYATKSRELGRQLKKTDRAIEKLEFVLCQLQAHGLPHGIDYKYLQHLNRNRPRGAPINAILPNEVLAMHSNKSKTHLGHSRTNLPNCASTPSSKANTLESSSPSSRYKNFPVSFSSYALAKHDHQEMDESSSAILDVNGDAAARVNQAPNIVFQLAPYLQDPSQAAGIKPVSSCDSLSHLEQQVNERMAALSGQHLQTPTNDHAPSSTHSSHTNLTPNGVPVSSSKIQNGQSDSRQSKGKSKIKQSFE